MTSYYRQGVMKKLLLAVWAMVTLVLLFAVGLLVFEMVQAGQQPLSTLRVPERSMEANGNGGGPEAPLGTREMMLYFASSDGLGLAPESAIFEYTSSTVENCRRALAALIAGPRDILVRTVPPTVRVRALYLMEDGELVVDFSQELQKDTARLRSAAYESLLVYGIVNTLCQGALNADGDTAVQRVRFLIEGMPPTDSFPAHFDLSDPVRPDPGWAAAAQERRVNG